MSELPRMVIAALVVVVILVLVALVAGGRQAAARAATAGQGAAGGEGAAGAPPPGRLPDTVAGRRAAALAAALHDGGEEAVRRFVAENFAASALAERSAEVRERSLRPLLADLGRGELISVEPAGPRAIDLVFKAADKPLWLAVRLELEPGPPHGILGMRITAEHRPPARPAAGPPLNEAQALAAIAAEAEKRAAAGEFSGVVAVAREGRPLVTRAWGVAERSFGAPVKVGTRFNLASIDKLFTQVVILQLAEEGKLDPQERLIRYLPDYPNRAVAEKVTIQQLLDHASGLGDFFGERFRATPNERLRTLADYLPLFVDQPLLFPPGSEQRYSNAGYVVLGLVIERLTGESYYEAVQRRVFARAGMTQSDFSMVDEATPDRAVGYTRERAAGAPAAAGGAAAAPLRSNVYFLPARGSSAGDGYSTAGDLLRFAQALREGRLLKPDQWRRRGGVGIAGGSPGCNAVLEDDWSAGYTLVVLANLDPPSAEDLAGAARGLLAQVRRRE